MSCRFQALGLAVVLLLAAMAPGRAQVAAIERSERYAAIVLDHQTGNILVSHHADALRHPASLTKAMTLYMLFEAMQGGRLALNSPIRMSAEAQSRPPSKLGLPVGTLFSVETAILALVTRSANDVAAAVGEHLAGSEEAFARQMTLRARQLGMTRTVFRNASGLPDPDQVTTARDMALLGRRLLQDFPQHYHYFSATHFRHNQGLIRSHNGMLVDYPGTDGIKTGYIRASGYNILTSAERGGVRLVGAVFGGSNWRERNAQMASLFDEGFARQGVRGIPPAAAEMAAAAAAGRVLAARAVGGGLPPPVPAAVAARAARPPATAQATARPPARAQAAARPPARAQAARTAPSRRQAARTQPARTQAAARTQPSAAARRAPANAPRGTRATPPGTQRVAGTR
ncbi:D-alanyl-D-alanine carboxypeptidase family protein [Roseococcus thiosulfatophilus]|uniref:D-alanyl-D-alanine carboxypeptidase family protein n=1 Tax=Roseococcus thiosulfatophilus TaxID=35813 RepID=UPI001A8D5D6C|nr:D-alanyl-D-alanine carboxypeptidase family protein [Roseococcus thiosulfatophilus]